MTQRLAVLASGGGRTLENLAQVIARGELDAVIALVVCDRPGAGVLARAERLGLEPVLLDWKAIGGAGPFADRTFELCRERSVDLVVLAGFLRLLALPTDWEGRVLNIHPSLLPAFGGRGYYGDRVHAAVLAAGVPMTGCTVHYVTAAYDDGPILLQREVGVEPGDTVDTLAARVFEAERIALPEAIRRHAQRTA